MGEAKQYKLIGTRFFGGHNWARQKNEALDVLKVFCCADSCTLRDEGKCACVPAILEQRRCCPFGKTEVVHGYKDTSPHYHEFRSRYESAPEHNAVKRPDATIFAKADDTYLFHHNDARLWRTDKGDAYSESYTFDTKVLSTMKEDEDCASLLHMVLTHDSWMWSDKDRKRSRTDSGPRLLSAIKKIEPQLYMSLMTMYPDLDELVFDPIGKKARLATLVDGSEVMLDGQKWTKMGMKISCSDYHASCAAHVFATGAVVLDIDPDYMIEVQDASWIDENTEFGD